AAPPAQVRCRAPEQADDLSNGGRAFARRPEVLEPQPPVERADDRDRVLEIEPVFLAPARPRRPVRQLAGDLVTARVDLEVEPVRGGPARVAAPPKPGGV